jgi:serine/threonine-protein kinase
MPVVAVLVIIGLGMLALNLWQKSTPGSVKVPEVLGLSVAQAQDQLRQAGLVYEVLKENQPSEAVPEGSVLAISPAPGRNVKAGRLVKILLSSGSAQVVIPNVRNLPKDAAYALLAKEELTVEGESFAYDATIPADSVIEIAPKSGIRVARHSSVKLTVSKGPELDVNAGNASGPVHSDALTINVPTDATGPAEVRIEVTDATGMHIVYRQVHHPGDSFVYTVEGQGDSMAVVYFGTRDFMTQPF